MVHQPKLRTLLLTFDLRRATLVSIQLGFYKHMWGSSIRVISSYLLSVLTTLLPQFWPLSFIGDFVFVQPSNCLFCKLCWHPWHRTKNVFLCQIALTCCRHYGRHPATQWGLQLEFVSETKIASGELTITASCFLLVINPSTKLVTQPSRRQSFQWLLAKLMRTLQTSKLPALPLQLA